MTKIIIGILVSLRLPVFYILAITSYVNAQNSIPDSPRPLPALQKQYMQIASLSDKPESAFKSMDTIVFPIDKMSKAFYRALKLRAVYIDVHADSFKLPPFPANSSKQTRAELDYVLQLQNGRTKEMIEKAGKAAGVSFNPFVHSSEATYNAYRDNLFYIGHSIGEWFNAKNLPKTADLIANVWQDQLHYMWYFKIKFNRARPNALDSRIKNLEETMWPAYPSGHATFAYTNAFLLQELLPEYKDIIYEDAYQTAHSREILGVHFPSDSEAGRKLARQLINEMLKNEKFRKDVAEAKAEIDKVKPTRK